MPSAETAFESQAGLLHDLGVESHAGELDKAFSVRARKIDEPHVLALNHVPAKLKVVRRQTELHGKDVHCTDWEQSQCDIASGETVDHLVDSTVAAGRNDFSKPLLYGLPGQRLCSTGMRCRVNETTAADRFNTSLPVFRLLVACGRIEDDDRITHTMGGRGL